jgi:hypothetical protein
MAKKREKKKEEVDVNQLWRNFIGQQQRCEKNCMGEFDLEVKHESRIVKKTKYNEDGDEIYPVFFVRCIYCGELIPLNPNQK